MKTISPRIHGILDYVTVILLSISPSLLKMESKASAFTYVLAVVHLLLTLCTDFEKGLFKVVSFKLHGTVELIVSIALIGAATWFRNTGDMTAFYYYLVFSVILFVVWVLSDYKTGTRKMIDEAH